MATSNIKMRYALVNGEKRLPGKSLHGICPLCGAEVISKCGTVRIPHWAHKSLEDCDAWSEGKTEWHIKWQDEFPAAWQEVTINKKNCIHRADICIPQDDGNIAATIEFQNSYLEQEEISVRESFYQRLIWVVDVSGRKRDLIRFEKNKKYNLQRLDNGGHLFRLRFSEELFPKLWLNCIAPVFFDFYGLSQQDAQSFYCLFPNIFGGERFVGCCSPKDFLEACRSKTIFSQLQGVCDRIADYLKKRNHFLEERNRALTSLLFNRISRRRPSRRL